MTPYFFTVPSLVIHMCLVTIPSISTLVMSTYNWNGLGAAKYIGFSNFIEIFTEDRVVGTALMNNLRWLAMFVTIPIITAFIISIIVSQVKNGQIAFRTLFFIPYIISSAVAGKIWSSYFNPYYGISRVFENMGWEKLADVLWLGDPKIALFSVAFVDMWHFWGFPMILFLNALQQIDPALYEAARVDGANRLQELWYVSVPGIRQTIGFLLIMTVMWSFLTFDYVYVMTYGGPANATEILATWIYKNAFSKYRAGYANALCVVQSLICVIFYYLQKQIGRKGGIEN